MEKYRSPVYRVIAVPIDKVVAVIPKMPDSIQPINILFRRRFGAGRQSLIDKIFNFIIGSL